jgi:hypothetical protein
MSDPVGGATILIVILMFRFAQNREVTQRGLQAHRGPFSRPDFWRVTGHPVVG